MLRAAVTHFKFFQITCPGFAVLREKIGKIEVISILGFIVGIDRGYGSRKGNCIGHLQGHRIQRCGKLRFIIGRNVLPSPLLRRIHQKRLHPAKSYLMGGYIDGGIRRIRNHGVVHPTVRIEIGGDTVIIAGRWRRILIRILCKF